MVTKDEVIEQYDIEAMEDADNVDLTEDDLDNGSKGQLIKRAGQLRD